MDGGLRAFGPRSLKSLFHRLFCAFAGQPLEISERVVRAAESGR